MLVIRQLQAADWQRLHEIDLSEHITLIYRLVDGELQPEAHDWRRPPGDVAFWDHQIAEWQDTLKLDVWLGAFVEERLAGLASLRYELAPNLAQLTTLHVSQHYRRQGVARALVQAVIELAQARGATSLYVSATPSESAVNFYLSQGFRPTSEPNPEMYALEPEDIHMIRPLSPNR
jgi:ribosomal protein S18 acetylase RimI-like enzyme